MKNSSRRNFLCAAGLGAASLSLGAVPGAAKEAKAECAKPKFQLGLASYTTRNLSTDETIKIAKRLGLKQVCFKSMHLPLDSNQEQIEKVVDKVKKAGLTLYGAGNITMKTKEQVDQAFEYGRMAGMKCFICVPYPEQLDYVEEKVKEYDIEIAIHNHGPGDKVYPLPESAYEKLKGRDPRMGLCVDIAHTLRIGGDPVKSIEMCGDRVLDLHLKDTSKAAPDGRTVVCGHGVIDLPGVLAALTKIGFSKNASFEVECDPDDVIPSLAESVGYIRGLLA